jgi:hypothetical protein
VRLVDVLLRRGHLSESALTEAILSGARPAHLDSCDACARRALDLGRWLDDIRATALEAADQAFPPERLALQQSQILRRLEQLDEPARVLAFPAAPVAAPRDASRRRVAPAWVGVAAAAGLVIGVISGQATARLGQESQAVATSPATPAQAPPPPVGPAASDPIPASASLMDLNLDDYTPDSLRLINDMTPSLVPRRYVTAQVSQ